MQRHHIGHRIKGFYRVAALGILWGMTTQDIEQRLKILTFFDKHGVSATCDAFGVSVRTLYRWRGNLHEAQVRQKYTSGVSLRTFITATDIANTALFLASLAASKITGQIINVDGHIEIVGGLDA